MSEPQLRSVFIQTTNENNKWVRKLVFYYGDYRDTNLFNHSCFKPVEGKRKVACLLGVAEFGFPVQYPLHLKNGLVVLHGKSPFLVSEKSRRETRIDNLLKNAKKGFSKRLKEWEAKRSQPTIIDHKYSCDIQVDYSYRRKTKYKRRKQQPTLNDKRHKIYKRDGYKCLKCGSTDNLTLDHILALSQGGTIEDNNLQTLCERCNQEKDTKTKDYRPWVEI